MASFTYIYYSVAIKQIRVLLISCPVAAVRRQGVRCCRPRFDAVIEDAIQTFYLTRQRPRVSDLADGDSFRTLPRFAS